MLKAQIGWFDVDAINLHYSKKYLNFRKEFEEYLESIATIEIYWDKQKYIDFMDNNSIIIEMINKS